MRELAINQSFTTSNKTEWRSYAIFLLITGIAFITTHTSKINAQAIQLAELVFIIFCLFASPRLTISKIAIEHRRIFVAAFLWLLSITLSFSHSPLNLFEKYFAWQRYFQTVMHIVTFFFFWHYMHGNRACAKRFVLAIPLSTFLVIGAFFYEWFTLFRHTNLETLSYTWVNEPPFNSNIRHTGYQATAGLSVITALFVREKTSRPDATLRFLALTMLWAFIFWLGGRGAIISSLGAVFFVWSILKKKRILKNPYSFGFSIMLGLIVSKIYPAMDWGGATRIYESLTANSLNDFSSNRIKIWLAAWESLQGHLMFGLGPQSYHYMPNHVVGYLHPHNILIQFIAEWGIVGTALFIYLLLKGFWHGIKLHIADNTPNFSALAAGTVIVALTLHAAIDGTYYHPQPSFYLALAYAIWVTPSLKRVAKFPDVSFAK